MTIWQELQRLSREEVATVIPAFHPVWAHVAPADLTLVDARAAHGNFRMWVTITRLAVEALTLFDQPRVDRKVLEWVFSKLGGSP
ncbi:hypothetical protein [Nonomuraea sp. NPDC001831]|uniref:hypothetical protein n=1 Tax=Nonomuraea sp. NPDC001831 TaxID=3364340 RepID=UPI00368526A7